LAYMFTSVDYADCSYWQTILATFLLGFIFIRFVSDKPIVAVVTTFFSAIGLTYFYPFFEWHASGMENAITHVLFLATVYVLYKSVKDNRINYWLAIIVFFATVTRIDSVYHIAILLVIYSAYWMITYKNLKAFYFSIFVFLLWILFQSWRYYYFGYFLPNTAIGQGISILDRIHMLLQFDKSYLLQSFKLSREIFITHSGWLLFSILPLMYFVKTTKRNVFLIILATSIVITSCFNPFLFGPTRIDHSRTTTQMALIVFVFISMIFYSADSKKGAIII